MAYEAMTGTVSHGHERVSVHGGKKSVGTKVTLTFRVNGTPVTMEGPAAIADNDVVTVVGERKSGEFHAYALRNESTGATYGEVSFAQIAFLAAGYLVSFLSMVVIVGFFLLAVMGWLSFKLYRIHTAHGQLRLIPPPAAQARSSAMPPPLMQG